MSATSTAAHPTWQPRIVAFVCRWCSSAGADMAGTTRLTYPSTVQLLRIPCTGRMNPMYITKAFENGADGVLISGCHPGDCHYVHGNLVARRRFTLFRSLMDLLGLDHRRLHFSWVSAAESHKWVEVVETVDAAVREVGPLAQTGASDAPEAGDLLLNQPAEPVHRAQPTNEDLDVLSQNLSRIIDGLLSKGEVSRVVAYGKTNQEDRTVPFHVGDSSQLDQIVWSQHCRSNLSVYLPRALEVADRVGIVSKACDVKAIIGLAQEGQLKREDVVIIGVPCAGVRCGDGFADKCSACTGEVPSLCDIRLRNPTDSRSGDPAAEIEDSRDRQIDGLLALPPATRWAYWQDQFERCLRCYACRAVCPLCYCDTCIADVHRPQWVPHSIDERGNTAWNTIRAHHLAGRCTGCDECARVCPSDIRLDLVNRHLAREVERQFGYRAGESIEALPPLTVFRDEDPEGFIL